MRRVFLGLVAATAFGLAACGSGDEEKCPGRVCSNCGASGDCNISCPAGQVQYCGHFGYFSDPGLRCTYCGPP